MNSLERESRYKFKFSPLLKVLLFVVLTVSIIGLIINVKEVVENVKMGMENVRTLVFVGNIIALTLTAFLLVTVVLAFAKSCYKVNERYLTLQFSWFRSRYKVSEIEQITYFKANEKIVAYFKDATFTVIVIDSKEYDEFVKTVRKYNGQIIGTIVQQEEKGKDE